MTDTARVKLARPIRLEERMIAEVAIRRRSAHFAWCIDPAKPGTPARRRGSAERAFGTPGR